MMEFLTSVFLDNAIYGSEADFERAMVTLRGQRAAVNSNPTCSRWVSEFTPITYVLFRVDALIERRRIRSAALVEALHAYCGARLDVNRRPTAISRSDASLALVTQNFEAFEALLLRCEATFEASEEPMHLIAAFCRRDDMLRYLRVLSKRRMPGLDPDAWFTFGPARMSALHYAVSDRMPSFVVGSNHYLATDPDAQVVDVLVNGLGANPDATDHLGRTPLDIVKTGAKRVDHERFDSDADYDEWRARVDETVRILEAAVFLRRADRNFATMTAFQRRLGQGSALRHLDTETVRHIAEMAHTNADADSDSDDIL